MSTLAAIMRYPLCMLGVHANPPPRYPHGPLVADCPCCGKTCYYYGLAVYGLGGPPVLAAIPARPPAALPR